MKPDSLTMAMNLPVVVVATIFASLLVGFGCHAIRIEVTPETCTSTIENAVYISCRPDSVNEEGEAITFMELSRNDEDPIAFLRDCSNISYGSDTKSQFSAEGHIHKDPSLSYLNVTLMNPRSEDTGVYTCLLYSVDSTGHIREERSSSNLVVDKLDIKSLELVLNQLKDQISTMETSCRKEIHDLKEKESWVTKRVKQLEETARNHSQEIAGFSDKLSYLSAFSASNKDDAIISTTGQILILPDVIMRKGQGYDEKTGIFTAPRAGLYVFHAVVLATKGCRFDLLLKSNNEILARLFAADTQDYSQSSMSSVVELSVGDRVATYMADSDCRLYPHQYTLFTGYLIKAF